MLTGTDVTARQEFSAQWHNLRAEMGDVGPQPSIDELFAIFMKSFQVRVVISDIQEEMWGFFLEQGCLTVQMLDRVRDDASPHFAERAERVLVERKGQPVQTRLPIGDDDPRHFLNRL
ncbi:hypothetical protein A2127_01070 [Candidatus Jorgensenbacteria bacterium GWC1_48_12]|uniref:Uncharacterized protein n=1 Tax=Candidatus Jorgensenbacteria bacterium GWC1_48_12 TaxID=1798469 RepID=A0A1F6BM83_9BACT|nr:MAG: hypothetical protein A2127_01070 [Candidatus Jorgensenbacteria bacterium GWC1_48_12]